MTDDAFAPAVSYIAIACTARDRWFDLNAELTYARNRADEEYARAEALLARVRELEAELADWQTEARKYVAEFKRLYERIAELETDDERAREARADRDAWQGRMQKRLARLMGPETRVAARDEETDDG